MVYNEISTLQKYIWLDQKLNPNSPKYNIGGYVLIEGEVNVSIFQKSIRELTVSNEIFSYKFTEKNGIPLYFLNKESYSDFIFFEESNFENAVSKIKNDFSESFGIILDKKLLFKIWLIKISDKKYIWYIKIHHLLADGFSFHLIFNKVNEIYNRISSNNIETNNKEKTKYSFQTYINEEKEYRLTQLFNVNKEFWLNEYKILEPLVYQKKNDDGIFYSKKFDLNQTESIKFYDVVKAYNLSPFHVFIGLLYIAISKYYGIKKLSIGIPIQNRSNLSQKSVIGPFINVIPLKLENISEISLFDFLIKIKRQLLKSYRHQRFQLADIIKSVVNERERRLYDIRLSYEKTSYEPFFSNTPTSIHPLSNESEDDPISIHIFDNGDQILRFRIDINSRFVPKFEITEILSSYRFLIEELPHNIKKNISEISICSNSQKKEIIDISKGLRVFRKESKNFISLWLENLKLRPENVAVISNEVSYTYQNLEKMSNRLANHLNGLNIKKKSRVVIDLPNSVESVVSILALFKIGGIYIPIDNSYPQKRKNYIIKDSMTDIVITNKNQYKNHQFFININEIIYDQEISESFKLPNFYLKDDAYIIYTSGSTGKPKGVVITHNSLYNYCLTFSEFFSLNDRDLVLQQSSLAFDTSIEEIFPILSVGGILVFANDSKDFHQIFLDCQLYKITVLSTNPFVINYLNQFHQDYQLELRVLISGGEVIKIDSLNNIVNKFLVYNTYGPTEGTVCATYHKITDMEEPVPIGRPISNTSVYILENSNLLPKGATGEIAISGKGIAREYLNNKEETNSSFINLNGETVYLTGDLGKWNANGILLFKGRKDDQLSYKGFRIEPEEIELQLKKSDSKILECKVVIKGLHQPSLVAYIKTFSNLKLNLEDLVIDLKKNLPFYMIPTDYVVLKKIPLTANGKIDILKLPKPTLKNIELQIDKNSQPTKEWEHILVKIWNELLNIKNSNIHFNFFELGGHSLLANQFISILRSTYKIEISLKDFYLNPTIEEIVKLIELPSNKMLEINKIPNNTVIPLSYQQEQLWFLSELDKNDSAYLVPGAIKLKGIVNLKNIEKVFNILIEKHEILRTVFRVVDGVPNQKILSPFKLQIPVAKLSKFPLKKQEAILKKFILEEGNKKFDIENGPLLRINLIELSETENILVLCEHHLIMDGWTQGILLKEFIEIYSKILANSKYENFIPTLQYKDYAYWQRNYMVGEVLDSHLTYWVKKLKSMRTEFKLPVDYERTNVVPKNGKLLVEKLSGQLSKSLRSFSKQNKGTLFITMLTGFKILISKLCNETDVAVGTGIANRKLKEFEFMLGMMVNTIVLRTKFDSENSLEEILTKVKKTSFEAYAYQDTPFNKVVEKIKPLRKLGVSPLIQYFFGFINTPNRGLKIPNLELEIINSHNRSSKFDLNITVYTPFDQLEIQDDLESQKEIVIEWEYNSNIFNKSTMSKMINMYLKILQEIITNPNQPYHSIDYISKKESQKLLTDFNQTTKENLDNKTIIDLFQEQVKYAPNKTILVFEDNEITYNNLDVLTNRFSNYLIDQFDVKTEDLIGIKLQRSEWLIITLLSVLKAGGVYVPIDPNDPNSRIEYVEKDSNCKVIIDESVLDDFRRKEFDYDKKAPIVEINSKNLMYVIYTSGSTGMPKGVMIEHGGIVNRLSWMWNVLNFSKNEIILQKTKFTFDVSVWEIFLPLCWGAKLIVCKEEDAYSPFNIVSLIKNHNITCIHFVPSMLNLFMKALFHDENLKNDISSLKRLITSGEVLPISMVQNWYRKLDFEICNLYGPTEASIDVTHHTTSMNDQIVPIGRPIWNTQIYILGDKNVLQPEGVIGEIFIGGSGLARGYINRPKLTREKFIENPFIKGEKIYKTGDLGRWLSDGNIEFLGRIDEQIKLRGYRIELGEIEHHLLNHKNIREAAVLLKEIDNEESLLVAYLVFDDNNIDDGIKDYLRKLLPDYMLPSKYVQLERLPLTGNGKIDKKSLISYEGNTMRLGVEYIPPQDKLELQLVQIWQEILSIEKIGINDNFFDIGGHSLRATKLVSAINIKFDSKLLLKDVFIYKTIREQKEMIEIHKWSFGKGKENTDFQESKNKYSF
ncbi:non-ribosomal peptide synthetase [Aquimarina addita]|uniref:Non-ribosomal peptide synthetase n=1 Tax=Aquimarina addita TaxID=870485 RepID=A0ABP6US99_9FLAO